MRKKRKITQVFTRISANYQPKNKKESALKEIANAEFNSVLFMNMKQCEDEIRSMVMHVEKNCTTRAKTTNPYVWDDEQEAVRYYDLRVCTIAIHLLKSKIQ